MSVSRPELRISAAKRRRLRAAGAIVAATSTLAGCANQTAQHYSHGHEYFSQAKYGHASPKVVADGEPVPRGGGQYLIGNPYRVAGHVYYPRENASYSAVGMASWYGAAFHGRRTANGEVYDMASLTAAHPTMPLPSYARVTNVGNGYSVVVRVNDRGPFSSGRVMDVSSRTADVLGFKGVGTARIKVDYVGPAPLEGSDDSMLLASLRTDGAPASLIGYSAPVMVASNAPPPEPAPPAELPRPARREAPSPPEPVRVTAADPEPAAEDSPPAPIRQPHFAVPLPPARPFDLGGNPGGLVVATGSPPRSFAAVMPPRRPTLQASAERALYFSDPALSRLKPRPRGAFERLKPVKASLAAD